MKILITNDDGMHASQLLPLIRWCARLGQVTAVVPKTEHSGKSHAIELHHPFEAKQVKLAEDITVWAVDSTPADCVRFAILGLKEKYDLVISGINRGFNMGTDILYSGTVGAASEAVLLGVQAVAVSTCPSYYEKAVTHLDQVFDFIFENRLLDLNDLYNVNIAPDASEVRITRQGGPYFSDDFLLIGNDLYEPKGKCVYQDRGDLTLDTDATLHGFITVTPMTISKTNKEVFERLTNMKL